MKVEVIYENCESRVLDAQDVKVDGITEVKNLDGNTIDAYYKAGGASITLDAEAVDSALAEELENKEITALIVKNFDATRPIFFSGAKQYTQTAAGIYIVVIE